METTVENKYYFQIKKLNRIVIMVTANRRENWGARIENICRALKYVVEKNEEVEIVYLVHLNPLVKNIMDKYLGDIKRVHLLPPLGIREIHNLMNKSHMVMIDLGGLQEEVLHSGKAVLVLRDVTERPEADTVKLAGTNYYNIIENAEKLLKDKELYRKMSNAINLDGDGKSSERIVQAIL